MKKDIKVYLMVQKTNFAGEIFADSAQVNDTSNYYPIDEEVLVFHNRNLQKPASVAGHLSPYTVFYFS